MAARECYHCKQEIEEGTAHDCWTTTEENLTRDLPEDLIDAWERLRETAAEFGDQSIYASHRSCSRARPVISLSVRKRSFWRSGSFLGGRSKIHAYAKSFPHRPSNSNTKSVSYIVTRSSPPSPTGSKRPITFPTRFILLRRRGGSDPNSRRRPWTMLARYYSANGWRLYRWASAFKSGLQ